MPWKAHKNASSLSMLCTHIQHNVFQFQFFSSFFPKKKLFLQFYIPSILVPRPHCTHALYICLMLAWWYILPKNISFYIKSFSLFTNTYPHTHTKNMMNRNVAMILTNNIKKNYIEKRINDHPRLRYDKHSITVLMKLTDSSI